MIACCRFLLYNSTMESFDFKGLKIRYWTSSICSDKAIILCPGLPASSMSEERIATLVQRNFHVFYVLYPGYPDSSAVSFLSQNPATLISDFITLLRLKGIFGVSLNKFFLIGSSFGGSVVLNIQNADKIVAFSPVTDYKTLYKGHPNYNYETLKSYLTKNGYKINNTGWRKLRRGELFQHPTTFSKEKTLVVFSKNDNEINPVVLEKFLKLKNIASVRVNSDKHLSFKNVQLDIFENILEWLEKANNILWFNDTVDYCIKKIISNISSSLSAGLMGGSLASENLVLESDVDICLISDHNIFTTAKKIKNHKIETTIMSLGGYVRYIKNNIRGLCKLFGSKIVTNNQNSNKKIEKLRVRMMKKYKDIFLIFQLLEKTRMENIKFIDASSPLAIKKGVGGRRSLGFMTTTYNALNDIYNPSFWNTLELMIADGIIKRADKEHIEQFFTGLIRGKLGQKELKKLLKGNDKIINKYIDNCFLKRINKNYRLGLIIDKAKVSVRAKGFINDVVNACYSKNPQQLSKLADKYRNFKDALKRHVIFYFLALNNNLSLEIGELVAIHLANEYSMNNIRRNLVENDLTTAHKSLLHLLTKDPNSKVNYYAKKKLRKNDILRAEMIRYSG